MRASLALSLLLGCASAPVLQPATLAVPPTITGHRGETASHLYARLIARVCVGVEYEHVVATVEHFLEDCSDDGQEGCSEAACAKLREEERHRCKAQPQAYLGPLPDPWQWRPRKPQVRTA